LRHPDPGVRGFGAGRLAAHGERDAIPAILAAMAIEPVPGVQNMMAAAAAQLGSDDGVGALRSRCRNRGWDPILRMAAARYMLDLGRNDCLGDVLDVLRSTETSQSVEDNQVVLQALSLIPQFKSVTPDELREIRTIVPVYFQSKFPWVRATLVSTLRQIGDPWAAEQLRNALTAEQEAYVRASIKSALAAIDSK
jgi:HEAT repeat protein